MNEKALRRLVKNYSANTINQILSMANRILLVPLFIYAWGIERYGQWIIITSLVSYLSITEFGVGQYVINKLNQLYVKDRLDEYSEYINSGLILFLIVPISIFIIIIAIGEFNILNFPQLSNIKKEEEKLIIYLLALYFLMQIPQGYLTGVYSTFKKYYVGVMLNNLSLFLQILLISVALYMKLGVIEVAIAQTIPVLLTMLLTLYMLRKYYPELNIANLSKANFITLRKIIKPSSFYLKLQVAQMVNVQGIIIIIGMVIGEKAVVIFTTIRTVANILKQFLGLVFYPLMPDITRLEAANDYRLLKELVNFLLRLILISSVIYISILYYYGSHIYMRWLSGNVSYDQILMLLICVQVIINIISSLYGNILTATNKHEIYSVYMLIVSIILVALVYYLNIKSLKSIAILMIAFEIFGLIIVPMILSKYIPIINIRVITREIIIALFALSIMMINKHIHYALILVMSYWLFRTIRRNFFNK